MKWKLVFGCVALYGMTCNGQTNNVLGDLPRFLFGPIQLRPQSRPPLEKIEPVASMSLAASSAADSVGLQTDLGDNQFHSRIVRPGQFYLTRPESGPDRGVARVLDRIFTPEVVYLGKIPITGSIVTAIKRKNPLCLLNPIVFQASW